MLDWAIIGLMRSPVLILLLASCAFLHAQDQERKLTERLLQPNRTLGSPLQNKAFSNGGGVGGVDTSKGANVKDFPLFKKFSSKAFDTRQFDAKNFWKGDFQFATTPAKVKVRPASQKTFDTKAVPVKDAREAGKGYDSHAYATREMPEKGKTSQTHLDDVYKGSHSQMNIDQVRDLLNKPRLD